MDKCREAFEKLPEINAILHNSEFGFNEDINQYYHPNHTEHRLNYAFLMGAWSAWQSRQAEVDALKNQLIKAGFTDRGGQLLVPPRGKPPCFDMLDAKQAEIDKKDKRIENISLLVISLRNEFDLHGGGDQVERQIELLEEALRGERE